MTESSEKVWHKVLEHGELEEGRVRQVTCGGQTVCLTHFEGKYGALDNRCPHQGGPLGEGAIENGYLRCPWHGWDYHPLTGSPPGGFDDSVETFEVEVRDDGIYVGFDPEPVPLLTVSDLLAGTMVNWDIRWVFGMVGHSNLGMADAIRRRVEAEELRYIGVRHEGAAAFAVSAYGKLTGRPAACLSIAGPGATNLLTGLWDANVDRAPALAITGQVQTQVLGPGAFQEIDLTAAFGRVAQWTQPVLASSNHAELVTLACKSAVLNRGVSHLILPDEVQEMAAPDGSEPGSPDGRLSDRAIAPPPDALGNAVDLLKDSKRPAIIVGHGARFHMEGITRLAELLNAPVITTFKAKGLIPDDHPLACGVLGRSGTPVASWFMNESDCLLVLGSSFSNHTGITPKKPTIQVDFDAMILGKFHAVDVPVWGEIDRTVSALHSALEGTEGWTDTRDEIAERWAIWRTEKDSRAGDDRGQGLNAAGIFAVLGRVIPDDAIITVDVGNNTYAFGRYFESKGQPVLMSGYLGSIGFGYPAALGAWAAAQEEGSPFHGRKVVAITGDGGFGQYLGELTTAVKYGMDITHILLNNNELGKISKEQRSGDMPVWETDLRNPDFAAFAELCGAFGRRVETFDGLETILGEALDHDGPALVELKWDVDLI